MITFFRKLRQKLLAQNKFTRYLFYAFGEILLVVIGILLALLINNINERRKFEEEFKYGLEQVNDDLEKMINEADGLISLYFKKDSLIDRVMKNQVTAEDYKKVPNDLTWLITNYMTIAIRDDGYNNLSADLKKLSPKGDSLVKQLKTIYDRSVIGVQSQEETYTDLVLNYLSWLYEKKTWASEGYFYQAIPSDEKIDYFLNDPLYKNHVTQYHSILMGNYFFALGDLRVESLKCKLMIDEYLGLESNFKKDLLGREHFIGTFANETDTIRISSEKGRLYAQYQDHETAPIVHIKDQYFVTRGTYFCSFIYNESNQIIGLKEVLGDYKMTYNKIE